jgi:hypothetical protein
VGALEWVAAHLRNGRLANGTGGLRESAYPAVPAPPRLRRQRRGDRVLTASLQDAAKLRAQFVDRDGFGDSRQEGSLKSRIVPLSQEHRLLAVRTQAGLELLQRFPQVRQLSWNRGPAGAIEAIEESFDAARGCGARWL